jgi:phytoene dehydrogenase-like protein
LEQLYERPETTTIDALRRQGFSERIIETFFRPFLGGVFLDAELLTSSRMFDFVFRMFSKGNAALPARGMGAMARQIADQLPRETLRTGTRVEAIEESSVRLASGEQLQSEWIVVACEAPAAARLLDGDISAAGQGVTCLYFAADQAPVDEPILVLNGEGKGPINNLCVPSQVAPTYAPPKRSLVSVTVLGVANDENALITEVHAQLRDWFGNAADRWSHLRTYRIPYALPNQRPPALSPVAKPPQRGDGLLVCGDYLDTASIQGAMLSGRHAAEQIVVARAE